MPPSWSETLSAKADLAACRATLKGGSKSFFAASLLLPASLRGPASALYAFCRVADDAVDQGGDRHAALAHLRERLDRAYAGSPLPSPIDRAFADVVARHAVPRDLPEALLEGLAWDAAGRTYETLSDLNAYAARVAGAVGAMMTVLMGARAPEVLARACDLGVAMQLSNIARDVGEDARAGRLYLPRTWLREAGIDPEAWLARPLYDQRLGKVVRRLLVFADQLYLRACAGIGQLPLACRPGIQAARILYAEIGREVERQGLDSVSARAVVPLRRKLGLLPKVFVAATLPGRLEALPPLPETRFLVDAVARAPTFSMDRSYSRVGFVLDLFEKLERLDRSGQVGRSAAGLS